MQRPFLIQRTIADSVVLLLLATLIYGVFSVATEWRSHFHPVTVIDLSIWALPYYTLMSAIRGIVAYFISLVFTFVVGYFAAKSKAAEKLIIPLLDILQSIPVLGFLPGLLLGLVTLFPNTNTGLELAAIVMIFTGQVWNMTFSFYSSLKSIPADLNEAATVIGLNWYQRLYNLELPYSAVNLAWNSLLSMAGGWFFLIPCEAMTLGDREYRLPGIGAYMDVAIKRGDTRATVLAVVAMVTLIVIMDFAIWRPFLSWVQRFRLETNRESQGAEPLMQIWLRESKIVRWLILSYRHFVASQKLKRAEGQGVIELSQEFLQTKVPKVHQMIQKVKKQRKSPFFLKGIQFLFFVVAFAIMGWGASRLLVVLMKVSLATWVVLLRDTLWTSLRVLCSLIISTLWAVPVGIWIGTSAKRVRIAQPLIQVLASFPAPMLYPLALGVFFAVGVHFNWGSMFLMLLGIQWYVLFNVLAGALRIPQELNYALSLMEASRWDRWKTLYLPSIFPSLVTGWITAAGGAWNASVVAEYLFYQGRIPKTAGLGASLSVATANENLPLFAASLTIMVVVVILLNRFIWSPIYHLAQTRFRMDG